MCFQCLRVFFTHKSESERWLKDACFQSLPRIDLDNYSALPVDEGDEDREAGIGDEEDEGSDLDIGDDPASAGEFLQRDICGMCFQSELDHFPCALCL